MTEYGIADGLTCQTFLTLPNMARVFAAGVAVAAAGAPDLTSYNYEQWMTEYGIAENSAEAEATFNANLAGIKEHNAANSDFWLEPNKFMAMNREEFKTFVKGRSSTGHLFQGTLEKADLDFSDVPDSKDWRDVDGVVSDVKDQGGCGSCWAFSAAETLESHFSIATGSASPKLSPQQTTTQSSSPQQAPRVPLPSALQQVDSNSNFTVEVCSAIATTTSWITQFSLLVTAPILARTTGWSEIPGEVGARRATSACSGTARATSRAAQTSAHRTEMLAMVTPTLAHTAVSAASCRPLPTQLACAPHPCRSNR